MSQRLGKLAVRHDPRTLKLARYTAALAEPPTACNLTGRITNLGPMLNNDLGDCTCAAIGHIIQAWTAEAGKQVILPDPDILAAYIGACGYVPGNAATDQGGVELDVLNYWRKTGVGGHTIDAYATLTRQQSKFLGIVTSSSWHHDIVNSVYYFGAAYIGVALPMTAQGAASWEVVSRRGNGRPGTWGGHAVPIVGYDADGVIVISWGTYVHASWSFIDMYMDEGYAVMSGDILGADGKSPEGFDLAMLQADLERVTTA